jgi:S-(hydroxymethyl)glutathione dehydrogenase/alcohol dehydrogenase
MSVMSILAAVCYERGEPLVVESLNLEDPKENEVRVRLKAAAICHSDIANLRGHWAGGVTPTVAGHEAAGIVESLGESVDSVSVGDHVVVTLVRSCGHCKACVAGHTVCCSGATALDSESRLTNEAGQSVEQGLGTAAFAEACVVHESQVVRIANDVPFTSAALLGCGVLTGFCSVTNIANVEAGSTVVVIGTGGLGLNAIQGAALSGASTVIAVDVVDSKLSLAKELGATHVINACNDDPVSKVRELCGDGADYVFVTAARSESFTQSIDMLTKFGSTVILGMPPDEDKNFMVDSHALTTGRKILGSKLGDTCIKVDIPRFVELYREGKLKLDEIISSTYALNDINEAIAASEGGEALRNVIVFD